MIHFLEQDVKSQLIVELRWVSNHGAQTRYKSYGGGV